MRSVEESDSAGFVPTERTCGFAIASLVFGILGLVTAGLGSLIAILLGWVALSKIRKSNGRLKGKCFATAGLALGIVPAVAGIAVIFHLRGNATLAKCGQARSDLRSLGYALEMYRLKAAHYPGFAQGLSALVGKTDGHPIPQRWVQIMSRLPRDLWGNSYVYRFPGRTDSITPEIICAGPDGTVDTDDDLFYQDFSWPR